MEREPLKCPIGVFDPNRGGECCVSCIHRLSCIWCRIYEKLIRLEEASSIDSVIGKKM